jgi:two-component system, chemotaxis family, sensor histidine kinase and response regulator PixL
MDTDQQVRLDFLSEAEEYFNSLESLLMDLDVQGAEPSLLDTAMRSAHSLKGGAAMMRYVPLSKVAHRLEDFLKILRVRKDNNLVDQEVTTLLLQGVDCMRAVRNLHQQQDSIDEGWLVENAEPIFERLRAKLGDLKDEDEDLLLAEEEQIDVSSLIFQSGVEECLASFKAQLEILEPAQLKAELAAQAEQLAEFGLMSQIEQFVQLCQSVQQQLAITPLEGVKELAQQALKLWERSHALVLVGRIDKLPVQLDGTAESPSSLETENISQNIPDIGDLFDSVDLEDLAELQSLTAQEFGSGSLDFLETDFSVAEFIPDPQELADIDAVFGDLDAVPEVVNLSEQVPTEAATAAPFDLDQFTPDATDLSDLNAAFAQIEEPAADFVESLESIVEQSLEPAPPVPNSISVHNPQSEQGRMVRVPAEQLQRLNDLSSRLILERNAAVLRLNQLQEFVSLTRERMQRLEQSSNQLRKLYDWASLEGMLPTAQPVVAASNSVWESASNSTMAEKFDSLEMDRYTDLHLLSQEQMETIVQLQEVTTDMDFSVQEMGQVIRNLNYTSRELQQNVMRSQMRPFAELVGRFPRLIRDLSAQHNKPVNLVIEGKLTQLDRQAIEYLSDPLTHLLRNAFDHGLEDSATRLAAGKPAEGKIVLKAIQEGNQTVITITDDGGGINTQKIRDRLLKMGCSSAEIAQISDTDALDAIFEPGFSTAEQVTELSGRGVGMDVVRSNLQQLRGDLQVSTKLGQGTTFTITVPLSLLVMRVIIVESSGLVFAVPIHSIKEVINYDAATITKSQHQEILAWNERSVDLIRLQQYLSFQRPGKLFEMSGTSKIQHPTVLIFEEGNKLAGIYLEKYWQEQEVAIRTVSTSIPLFPGFTGSTVLGDGRVIPLIEPSAFYKGLLKQQRASLATLTLSPIPTPLPRQAFPRTEISTILIVDDSVHVRRYLAGFLERNGYRVEEAKDGQDAVDKLKGGLEPQAVICDVEMPRLDGYGVLSELKSEPKFANLPIAMLTSRSNDKHRNLALKLGAAAYFSKPFNEQEMLQTLASLIEIEESGEMINS